MKVTGELMDIPHSSDSIALPKNSIMGLIPEFDVAPAYGFVTPDHGLVEAPIFVDKEKGITIPSGSNQIEIPFNIPTEIPCDIFDRLKKSEALADEVRVLEVNESKSSYRSSVVNEDSASTFSTELSGLSGFKIASNSKKRKDRPVEPLLAPIKKSKSSKRVKGIRFGL